MIISAAVPMAIPAELIAEITFMTLWDFFANRYLRAMNNPVSKLFFKQFFYMSGIVQCRVQKKVKFGHDSELGCARVPLVSHACFLQVQLVPAVPFLKERC